MLEQETVLTWIPQRRLRRLRSSFQLDNEEIHQAVALAWIPPLRLGRFDSWLHGNTDLWTSRWSPLLDRCLRSWLLPRHYLFHYNVVSSRRKSAPHCARRVILLGRRGFQWCYRIRRRTDQWSSWIGRLPMALCKCSIPSIFIILTLVSSSKASSPLLAFQSSFGLYQTTLLVRAGSARTTRSISKTASRSVVADTRRHMPHGKRSFTRVSTPV